MGEENDGAESRRPSESLRLRNVKRNIQATDGVKKMGVRESYELQASKNPTTVTTTASSTSPTATTFQFAPMPNPPQVGFPYYNKDSDEVILMEHRSEWLSENKRRFHRILGFLFFFHFNLIWAGAFVCWPLFVYAVYTHTLLPFKMIFVAMTIHAYTPLPKHYNPFRRLIFENIPRYFDSFSFRVLNPETHAELRPYLQPGHTSTRTHADKHTQSQRQTVTETETETEVELLSKTNNASEGPDLASIQSERSDTRSDTGSDVAVSDVSLSKLPTSGDDPAPICLASAGAIMSVKAAAAAAPAPPNTIKGEGEGSDARAKIWLVHPHGFVGFGWGMLSWQPYFNSVWNCVSSLLYYQPPIIWYSSLCGRPSPVSASRIKQILQSKGQLSILPGGFEEATIGCRGMDRFFLKKRLGLFKYALQYDADLIPVISFGESDMYDNVQGFWKQRLRLSALSIPGALCHGPWRLFPWIPHPTHLHILVGPPVHPYVERSSTENLKPEPSSARGAVATADILELQERYSAALEKLYHTHKTRLLPNAENRRLEIW